MSVFFIADPHFGDTNIIKYENRPFANAAEMDETIINNWNNVVTSADVCFILGDFSFYNETKTKEITSRLNGHKNLIIGNHDNFTSEYYRNCGFEIVSEYPIIYDGFWMLSHEPLYISENMPYANIFGHVHKNPIYSDYSSRSFCACADRLNFTPISFQDIKNKMGNK